jgi:peptidoglycan/xylan/chitin deacetylase (PgdA/CDA1 family)
MENVMRSAFAIALAISMSAGATAWAQNAQPLAPATSAAPAATPAAPTAAMPAAPRVAAAPAKCDNPNALGVSRVVEIDTTGGPGFGFEHFKAYDFLRDHEIVLTFDDGPWPGNTPAVLKALADQCTKAVFFPIGKHAGWHPEIMKQVAAAGHTVGSHTWSHKDLSKLSEQEGKDEIEKGIAAVSIALGNKPVGPFFRFPALRHPPELLKYVGERNLGVFSTDMDSFDFKMRKPEQVIASVMKKLEKHGKGIILMHDFQQATAHAAPDLLKKLKDGGYKVVQVVGKTPAEPKKEYVDMVLKEMGGGLETARPMSSVIKDIGN